MNIKKTEDGFRAPTTWLRLSQKAKLRKSNFKNKLQKNFRS